MQDSEPTAYFQCGTMQVHFNLSFAFSFRFRFRFDFFFYQTEYFIDITMNAKSINIQKLSFTDQQQKKMCNFY